MSVSVYEHQQSAIDRLHNGCVLVGGVGSGKSRTSLGYFFKLHGGKFDPAYKPMTEPVKDLYIITTARKRDTFEWDDELRVYLMSTVPENNLYKNKVVIDSWNNIQKYQKVTNAFFIFDEQRVVGRGTWVKAFIEIARHNQWILLSATPGDTWSDYAPVFIANGFYKNRSEFERRHCVYSRFTKYPKIDHYVDCGTLSRFRDSILVYMNFERPTIPHHEIIKVEYDKELYSSVVKTKWNIYKDMPCQDVASLCAVLRKIVNSDPSRLWVLHDIYEKHGKVIVFYNYDYELELLRDFCKLNNIIFSEWNGHEHQPIPKTDRWFYLVQYAAGAEGWNCIETDCTVFYSQNYSYKMMTQAAGRIDRMNTPFKELYFYHFRSPAPIDNAIANCLRNKKNFNEQNFIKFGVSGVAKKERPQRETWTPSYQRSQSSYR